MNRQHPAAELAAGYEALRAEAVGDLPTAMPRGRALLLAEGLPVWMGAWAASPPPRPPVATGRAVTGGLGAEAVRLLTEMALGRRAAVAVP
jgi:hypothetical protein